jgi:hypothetical protein
LNRSLGFESPRFESGVLIRKLSVLGEHVLNRSLGFESPRFESGVLIRKLGVLGLQGGFNGNWGGAFHRVLE